MQAVPCGKISSLSPCNEATGKKASSLGFVTKTSTARITRSVQRKAAKWLSKRKSVTAFQSLGSSNLPKAS